MKSALNSDCCEANRVKSPLNSNRYLINERSEHQASDIAELWHEFFILAILIAKIFGAVSRTKKEPHY